jgi:hypothetical protein
LSSPYTTVLTIVVYSHHGSRHLVGIGPVAGNRFLECLSPNLADRRKEFDFVESYATITNSYIQRLRMIMLVWLKHNHIQWLKNMRCMRWKSEQNNAVVVALNKPNGMMGAVAI